MQRGWEALQEAAGAAGVQLRKLDKKVEKVMLQEHRAMLTDRLKAEESPAEALSLAVPLLAAQASSFSTLAENSAPSTYICSSFLGMTQLRKVNGSFGAAQALMKAILHLKAPSCVFQWHIRLALSFQCWGINCTLRSCQVLDLLVDCKHSFSSQPQLLRLEFVHQIAVSTRF